MFCFRPQLKFILPLLASGLCLIFADAATAVTRFVKPGGTGTGTTDFSNASGDIQAMITASSSGDEIWVAAGTYKPTQEFTAGVTRSKAFIIQKTVKIYGGFKGVSTETALSQRNLLANPTILSGDIAGTPSDPSDDCHHVVLIRSYLTDTFPATAISVTETTQLDGFVITKGNANGTEFLANVGGGVLVHSARPIIQNCDIVDNRAGFGGGAHVEGTLGQNVPPLPDAHPRFIACSIRNNVAGGIGGLCNKYDETTLINCEVSGNQATAGNCGGVRSASGGGSTNPQIVTLINCTIANNSASGDGGGLVNAGNMFVYNSIVFDNTAAAHPSIASGGTITIDECNIEGTLALGGTSTINDLDNSDPLFMSATNLRIAANSPSRNAGDNTLLVADTYDVDNDSSVTEDAPDADRATRIQNSTVDQGAYENHASATCCADINGSGCINVDDLLLVINGWNFAGSADIVPACGGNGVVNVDDLLAVINAWGDCSGNACTGSLENDMPTSVNDCMNYCSQQHPGDQAGYTACVNDCVDALCKAEIIDCD